MEEIENGMKKTKTDKIKVKTKLEWEWKIFLTDKQTNDSLKINFSK